MHFNLSRNCPLCNTSSSNSTSTFPYATYFNDNHFDYLQCNKCSSVFIDPVPDSLTFSHMYAKESYHDCFYIDKDNNNDAYIDSARLLSKHLPEKSIVLDYGCGTGAFLCALHSTGFIPYGVEFDAEAAKFASENAECTVVTVSDFKKQSDLPLFDAIHLGDVLEHLPDPMQTLRELIDYLKPNGVIFVEGPLERNASIVFWIASILGWFKHKLKPKFVAEHTPTHLFFTNEKQQLDFFYHIDSEIKNEYWQVYESGWPYIDGGIVKRFIARIAIMLGGTQFLGITFGNRFRGIFRIIK